MTVYSIFSQARNIALWFWGAVFIAFAVCLFSRLGTAQAENHPMQTHGYFVPSENLYVPPKPDRLPSLVPGQQFICIPDSQKAWDYFDAADNRPLQRSDLALKVLTLVDAEGKAGGKPALRFLLEGTGRSVLLFTKEEDVTKLPGLQPLVQDDTLHRLQSKYVGKKVWIYGDGDLPAIGITGQPNTGAVYYLGNSQPVVIKCLVRVHREQSFMALGPGVAGISAANPLIAVLGLPQNFHWRGAGFEGPQSFLTLAQASPYRVCLGFLSNRVDDWDFERTFSLANLSLVQPHWPREIRLGMTPEMVAWVQGWPPEYGTMAQLRKEGKWQYPTTPPFSYWVYFKNGKVVKFGADGHLP